MLITLVLLTGLLFAQSTAPTTQPANRPLGIDPFKGPKPLAVFIQQSRHAFAGDPWARQVEIYETGEVIFSRPEGDRVDFHRAALSAEALADLRSRLEPLLALEDVPLRYYLRPPTQHGSWGVFYLRDGDRELATTIQELTTPEVQPRDPEGVRRAGLPYPPDELLALHKWMTDLNPPDSEPWTPQYVRVLAYEAPNIPPGDPIQWPAEWPGLCSDRAEHVGGGMHLIYLEGKHLPRLQALIMQRREDPGPFEIDGRHVSVTYRYVFPSEPERRRAMTDAADAERKAREAERSQRGQ